MPRGDKTAEAKRLVAAMYGAVSVRDAAAIGRVAVQWARVEDYLGHLISSTLLGLGNCEAGLVMTAELSAVQRAVTLGTLIECARVPEWSDRWREIYRDFERLRVRRNNIVHAALVRGASRGTHHSWRVKARGSLLVETAPVSGDDVKGLAEEIAGLLERVVAFDLLLCEADAALHVRAGRRGSPNHARTRTPSAAAQAQDQARARKKARREADRAASRAVRDDEPGSS